MSYAKKVFLICKIYLFCIYYSLNKFNHPPKKIGNPFKINKILPQKFRGIPAKLLRKKNKACLGFGICKLTKKLVKSLPSAGEKKLAKY